MSIRVQGRRYWGLFTAGAIALAVIFVGAAGAATVVVTLDGVPANIQCGETWMEAGVELSFVETTAEDDCDPGRCSYGVDPDQVWLYPSRLNLNLAGLSGVVTSVEVDVHDNCRVNCTRAFLYDGAVTVDNAGNVGFDPETLTLTAGGANVDRVAVSSCEGAVLEIRIYVVPVSAVVVTLDGVRDDILCGETWMEAGVELSFVMSTAEDCSAGRCEYGVDPDQVWLWPGRLNLDLTGLSGIVTRVEVDVHDYCGVGCTQAFLYDGAVTVDNAGNVGFDPETLTLTSGGTDPDRLAVSSCEGAVLEIRIYVVPVSAVVVTLDGVRDDILCGETWMEAGVELSFVMSTAEDCSAGRCEYGVDPDQVWLWPGRLNLDLTGLSGIVTRVEVDVHDYCGVGCTRAFLYEGAATVDNAENVGFDPETLVLVAGGSDPDRVAVSSCEGAVTEIRIYILDSCVEDGDVTNDGQLTAGDALCCFNISLLGGVVPQDCDVPNWDCELAACDVNCDMSLTAGDALEIFNRSLMGMGPLQCFAQPLGLSAGVSAETDAFDVPVKDEVSVGNRVTVPVLMEATRGAAAFGFEVHYDPETTKFDGIVVNTAAEHWKGLGAHVIEPGVVRVMGFDTEGLKSRDVLQDGMVEIAELRFEKLSDDAQLGHVEWIEQRLDREFEDPDGVGDRVTRFDLGRPFPNPFRDGVSADVRVPTDETSNVRVSVFDVKGRLVRVLLNEAVSGGAHSVSWDRRTAAGRLVSSGIYFLRMEVKDSGFVQTHKMVLLR